MSDRPTPETDAAVDDTAFEDKNQLHTDWVTAFFARKLERERDEAREDAEYYRERYNQLKDELKS